MLLNFTVYQGNTWQGKVLSLLVPVCYELYTEVPGFALLEQLFFPFIYLSQ